MEKTLKTSCRKIREIAGTSTSFKHSHSCVEVGWWYLDYSINSGPFSRFSMIFEFLSETHDHSVCETRDPSLTIDVMLHLILICSIPSKMDSSVKRGKDCGWHDVREFLCISQIKLYLVWSSCCLLPCCLRRFLHLWHYLVWLPYNLGKNVTHGIKGWASPSVNVHIKRNEMTTWFLSLSQYEVA